MGLGTWSGNCWALTDDLAQPTWPDFATQWARGPEGTRKLDFEVCDLLDGYAMGALTRLLADWLDGGGRLVLLQPPRSWCCTTCTAWAVTPTRTLWPRPFAATNPTARAPLKRTFALG